MGSFFCSADSSPIAFVEPDVVVVVVAVVVVVVGVVGCLVVGWWLVVVVVVVAAAATKTWCSAPSGGSFPPASRPKVEDADSKVILPKDLQKERFLGD